MRARQRSCLCILLAPLLPALVFIGWYINDQRAPSYSHLRRHPDVSAIPPSTKLVLFNQLRGAGFNNQLQETLLLSYIAFRAGRAYVYRDMIWRPRGYDIVPAEVFYESITTPPAISEEAFRAVCETWGEEISEVSVRVATASELVDATVKLLESHSGRCLYLKDRIMDWVFLETTAALDLYPAILGHIRSFTWSSAVTSAVWKTTEQLGLTPEKAYIAIHLRRGDFMFHCPAIVQSQNIFNLWARLPGLSDSLSPTTLSNATLVLERCWPSLYQIIDKVTTSAQEHEKRTGTRIRSIYALHDAKWDAPWVLLLLRQLELHLLHPSSQFRRFKHSSHLPLTFKEKDMNVPVDIEIARHADVFIGNGFSSLSSNVVLFRLADGKRPETNLFW